MSQVDAVEGRVSLRQILDDSKLVGETFIGIRVKGDLIMPERAAEFPHMVGVSLIIAGDLFVKEVQIGDGEQVIVPYVPMLNSKGRILNVAADAPFFVRE